MFHVKPCAEGHLRSSSPATGRSDSGAHAPDGDHLSDRPLQRNGRHSARHHAGSGLASTRRRASACHALQYCRLVGGTHTLGAVSRETERAVQSRAVIRRWRQSHLSWIRRVRASATMLRRSCAARDRAGGSACGAHLSTVRSRAGRAPSAALWTPDIVNPEWFAVDSSIGWGGMAVRDHPASWETNRWTGPSAGYGHAGSPRRPARST